MGAATKTPFMRRAPVEGFPTRGNICVALTLTWWRKSHPSPARDFQLPVPSLRATVVDQLLLAAVRGAQNICASTNVLLPAAGANSIVYIV
ncbi:unnamed protein product, partial [Iphiclides podalirius]